MASTGEGPTTSRSNDDELARVSCPICFDIHNELQSLRCGHVICEQCVYGLLEKSNFDDFPCAICRETSEPRDIRPDFTMRDNVARYCAAHNMQLPVRSESSLTNEGWKFVPTSVAKLPSYRNRLATFGQQHDTAAPYCNVIVHSARHGDVPGKGRRFNQGWYSFGGREYYDTHMSNVRWLVTTSSDKKFALQRHSRGSSVPANAIACGSPDDSGVFYAAVGYGQHGSVPGKARDDTCWYPWGGKEFATDDFSWVVVTPTRKQ